MNNKLTILEYAFFAVLPMVLVLLLCVTAGHVYAATGNLWVTIAWMYAYFCTCLYGAFRFGSEHLLK